MGSIAIVTETEIQKSSRNEEKIVKNTPYEKILLEVQTEQEKNLW